MNIESSLPVFGTAGEAQSESTGLKVFATQKTVAAILLGLIIVISWLGFLDTLSADYVDSALKQALVTYGVARGVNAVVSILQTIHVFGLGVGEVLDPLNDLVERFSSVMELAIASLVIQKVLLEITSGVFFKMALTASGVLLILSMYIRTGVNTLLVSRVFISLVFVRFSIALMVFTNGMVASAFITEKIDADGAAVSQVEKGLPATDEPVQEEITQAAPATETPVQSDVAQATTESQTPEADKKGFLARMQEKAGNVGAAMKEGGTRTLATVKEFAKKFNPKALKEKLEKVIPNMLNLMALFLLQTLILPVVFLYGMKMALQQVWNIKPFPLYTGKPRLAPRI